MNPLFFLGLVVGTSWVAGTQLNDAGLNAEEMDPKIGGQNQALVIGGVGLLLAVFGGPLGMAVGAGLASAAAVSNDAINKTKTVIEKYIESKVLAALSDQGGGGGGGASPGDVKKLATNIMDLMSEPE